MRFADLVAVSGAVAETAGRLAKVRHLADLLTRTPPDLVPIVAGFLIGEPRQGRLNVGR
jgi:DNA ligase-1